MSKSVLLKLLTEEGGTIKNSSTTAYVNMPDRWTSCIVEIKGLINGTALICVWVTAEKNLKQKMAWRVLGEKAACNDHWAGLDDLQKEWANAVVAWWNERPSHIVQVGLDAMSVDPVTMSSFK